MQLRPYQTEIIQKILESTTKRQLISLPTGTGKTIIFSELARQLNQPTLILAHRDELIQQAKDKLLTVWPNADVGIIKAEKNENHHQITIASIQTLARTQRLKQVRPDIQLIVTDEAHHACATSYKQVYHHFNVLTQNPDNILHLGVTATPLRNDKLGLATIYDDITYQGQYIDFVQDGYLCDLEFHGIHCSLDLDNIKTTPLSGYGRDFQADALATAINTDEIRHNIVDAYQKYAADKKHTLGFAVDRDHAQSLHQTFIDTGIDSGYIDGETPIDERKQILHDFRQSTIKVLWNILVLTEGYDEPNIDCILLARPSKSPSLLTQIIGRGTRTAPGKKKCTILDIAHSHRVEHDVYGNIIGHAGSLLNLASLFYPPLPQLPTDAPEKPKTGTPTPQTGGGYTRPGEHFLGKATSQDSIFQYLKTNYNPTHQWHHADATPRQIQVIRKRLPNLKKKLSRGEASALLDNLYQKPTKPKNPKNICPHCNGWKQPKYPHCYPCARKQQAHT